MTISRKSPAAVYLSLATTIGLSFSAPVLAQTKSSEDAQALLQEVKKRELERQVAAKQTDLNRLNEDLTKERKESDDLKRSIDKMGTAIMETSSQLDQLAAERTRLTQALEVANLRIDAEKLKLSGLKMLSDAQNKALGTLTSRIEDTDLRATLGTAELRLMSEGPILDGGNAAASESTTKLKSHIAELKKQRARGEKTGAEATIAAREAMLAATAKLQLAENAAGKAKKRADELGLAEIASGPIEKDAITAPKAIPLR